MIDQIQDTIYALAASGAAIYAARASGLYRSDDEGKTWHDVLASLGSLSSLALSAPSMVTAVAADGDTLLAGTNGAVLRSTDSGDTWQIVPLSSPPPQVSALVISPNFREDGVVLAGTAQDGVFVSTDRGATFIPWNFGLLDLNVYALAISPDFPRDQVIFAGTLSGIFRSTNGGRSWRETSFPMDAAPVLSLAIASNGSIYAGTEAHGLFVSDDFGATWRQVGELGAVGVNALQIRDGSIWSLAENRVARGDGAIWLHHESLPADKVGIALLPLSSGLLVGCADGALLHLP